MNTAQEVRRWVISPRDAGAMPWRPGRPSRVTAGRVVEAVCGHAMLGGAVIPVNVPRGAVCLRCEWGGAVNGDQPPGPGEVR